MFLSSGTYKIVHNEVFFLKVRLMKSLAVSDQKKKLDLEEFFNTINVRNDPLIQIKKNMSFVLNISQFLAQKPFTRVIRT